MDENNLFTFPYTPSIEMTPYLPSIEEEPIKTCKELADALSLTGQKIDHEIESHGLVPLENTNYNVVSAEEIADIHRFMSNANVLTRDFDRAILTLRSFRWKLERFTRACKRFVSAMGRVPPEIWAEIFVVALSPHYLGKMELAFGDYHDAVHPSLLITRNVAQVCRLWRSIALGTPRLWNTMHVSGREESNQAALRGPLEMLSRAISVPSYLVVGLSDAHPGFLQRCQEGILSAFEQKCHGLELYTKHRNDGMRAVVKLFEYSSVQEMLTRFKRLEKLSLLDCKIDVAPDILSVDWCNLTHLRLLLRRPGGSTRTPFVQPAIPNLKVLVLELMAPLYLDLTSLPSNCPRLTDFFLSGTVSRSSGPFFHAGLKRVGLQITSWEWFDNSEPFLNVATMPSMTELVTTLDDKTERQLTGLLLRSKCQLTRLVLIDRDFDENSLRRECKLKALGHRLASKFGVLTVEFSDALQKTRMMREVKDRWYL